MKIAATTNVHFIPHLNHVSRPTHAFHGYPLGQQARRWFQQEMTPTLATLAGTIPHSVSRFHAMSVEETATWIQNLGRVLQWNNIDSHAIAKIFLQYEIDGSKIVELKNSDLKKMNIVKLGYRMSILKAVKHLCQVSNVVEQLTHEKVDMMDKFHQFCDKDSDFIRSDVGTPQSNSEPPFGIWKRRKRRKIGLRQSYTDYICYSGYEKEWSSSEQEKGADITNDNDITKCRKSNVVQAPQVKNKNVTTSCTGSATENCLASSNCKETPSHSSTSESGQSLKFSPIGPAGDKILLECKKEENTYEERKVESERREERTPTQREKFFFMELCSKHRSIQNI